MELIYVADSVAKEKNISREEVLEAMELAIDKAARTKYGHEYDIRTSIDKKTGDIHLYRYLTVVDKVEDEAREIALDEAKKQDKALEIGAHIKEPLPPIDFGRVAAQTARQVVFQKVRQAERAKQYEEFKDRVGTIINGVVKRVEHHNVFVDVSQSEAMLRGNEIIPGEMFKVGDRVRAYIMDVREEPRGPQIFLSRTHPMFLAKLFAQEVPEIYDGVIEVKAVARDPGSRAKISVFSHDSSIDPVGACVGLRGNRVKAIIEELKGEKIDIIAYSPDPATFVVDALSPAEVVKLVFDEDANRVDVVVPDDQFSIAVGRRGQNVRLASSITGWNLDIVTETEQEQRQAEEHKRLSTLFMEALDVDDVIAAILIAEGFSAVEEIAYIDQEDMFAIEDFDEELASELMRRAQAYLDKKEKEALQAIKESGMQKDLLDFEFLNNRAKQKLSQAGIKTLDDLADLAADELLEHLDKDMLTLEEANDVILKARAHWFEDEDKAKAEEGA